MANLYARDTALTDVKGRSDYISNPSRQEEILLHEKNMKYTWNDYVNFENENQKTHFKNVQARETVVALPNELSENKDQLKSFCDDIAKSLYGNNRDYEYSVHWNEKRTNLHVHFIYSEREINSEAQIKRYKRDLWVDPKQGRTCSKNAPGAILRCQKGDIQRDKNGNPKYDTSPFTIKDKKYNNKNWIDVRNKRIKDVFDKYNYKIHIFDKSKGFIPQKKLYKGAREDYKEWASLWNKKAINHNKELTQLREKKANLKKHVKASNFVKKYNQEQCEAFQRQLEIKNKGFIAKTLYKLFYKKYDDQLLNSYDRAYIDKAKSYDKNFPRTDDYIKIAKTEYKKNEVQLIQSKKDLYEKMANIKAFSEYRNKEIERQKAEEKELREKYPEIFEEYFEKDVKSIFEKTKLKPKIKFKSKNLGRVRSRDDDWER